MRELLSKLVAGGLSAAVILLWWPNFVHDEGAVSWLARGVAWTLSFELLLLALLPLERALWDSAAARRVRDRTNRLSAPRRVGSRAALACGALAVPALLLATAPSPSADEERGTEVRHVTEVKRIVRVERAPAHVRPPQPQAAGTGTIAPAGAAPTGPGPERVASRRPAAPRRSERQPTRQAVPDRGGRAPQPEGTGTEAPAATGSPAPESRAPAAERPAGVA